MQYCLFLLHRKKQVLACAKIGEKCVLKDVFRHIVSIQFCMSAVCNRSAVAVSRPLVPSLDVMLPALVAIKRTSQLTTTG